MQKKDIEQLRNELNLEKNLELPVEQIIEQIKIFENGIPYLKLVKACTIGDGIEVIPPSEQNKYIGLFNSALDAGRIIKFVPASGAASRMFKKQLSILIEDEHIDIKLLREKSIIDDNCTATLEFFKNINRFAFYNELKHTVKSSGRSIENLIADEKVSELINFVTTETGLNYSNLPKGCILFHKYEDGARTAFEEHLVEAMNYSAGKDKTVRTHFTISPEHGKVVKKLFQTVIEKYSSRGWKFEMGFSFQSPSTNTVSVTLDNKPFRDDNGQIVFRPGGHGALLKNLDDLKADIILIKNIDNVVQDHLKDETYKYKKILGGYFIYLQKKIFSYVYEMLDENSDKRYIDDVSIFIKNELGYEVDEYIHSKSLSERKKYLFEFLNRPIRVCGMVKNEGHPGGGPFWVASEDGSISKQVVETSQIDLTNNDQKKILNSATHFSPVDFVCGVRDYKGRNFQLQNYSNPNTGLITIKSKDGKELKALELPGLWNGGMYNWITIFVEVPGVTFNPVKEVNDLLKPEHQPQVI